MTSATVTGNGDDDPSDTLLAVLSQAVGGLTNAATARMERDLAWFRDLDAGARSWIALVAQAGIKSFLTWYAEPGAPRELSAQVFGDAPQALTGLVSLQQTVQLVRTTIEVVEENLDDVVAEEEAAAVRLAIMLYAREVAFATAEVYARAAEQRGAWDARLEALAVDSVLRSETDDTLRSRAAALGWRDRGGVTVVLGHAPSGERPTRSGVIDEVHGIAAHADLDALCAIQGDRLVVVLGGVTDPVQATTSLASSFGDGPLVVGPLVDDLVYAGVSARSAVAGFRSAEGWPSAPRPVSSADLLPERALAGDETARHDLVDRVHAPLASAGGALLETVSAYLEQGGSLEATARVLFVHANTVRYRLRRACEVTHLEATDPRDAYTLRIALTLGRLAPGSL